MICTWSKAFRFALLFVLGYLLVVVLAACQPQKSELPSNKSCHWVEHVAGKTCVPDQIERLVTLDSPSFENAIALGLKPVGTVDTQRLTSYLQDQLEGVIDVGESGEPNLERVLTLKPDLILGLGSYQHIYSQAAQIAPTVLLEFEHSGLWKEVFHAYSETLHREDVEQEVMANYRQRLQEFKQRFEVSSTPKQPALFQVSVVRIYPARINLYFRDSFPGIVLRDAGLARPEAQDISASEAQDRYQNPIQASISLEALDQADGDALFVWTSESTPEENQAAQHKWKELQADPLWQQLNAVQNNRVYFVPSYWIGSGPLAANAILDDLFKYLIATP